MATLIRKIAEYLVSRWSSLSPYIKEAVKAIVGSAIVDAIVRGVEAVVSYLSGFGSWVIEQLARLLGLA